MPKFVGEVTIPKGSVLRMGEVNPLFGLSGGGTQFDFDGAIYWRIQRIRENF